MIVVDTNIISEVMRPQPSPLVLSWLNFQHSNQLFVTTITLAEICLWLAYIAGRSTPLAAA
jgi:predicted nucleic acid-binding protein